MCQIVAIILSIFSGGLAGAIAANWFTGRREESNRRRTFRAYVKSVRAELMAIDSPATKGEDFIKRYEATIAGVRRACCEMSGNISCPDFEKAWVDYCGMTEAQMTRREGKFPDDGLRALAPDYDRGRLEMVGFLDAMISNAK